jgi:hypothetical protein
MGSVTNSLTVKNYDLGDLTNAIESLFNIELLQIIRNRGYLKVVANPKSETAEPWKTFVNTKPPENVSLPIGNYDSVTETYENEDVEIYRWYDNPQFTGLFGSTITLLLLFIFGKVENKLEIVRSKDASRRWPLINKGYGDICHHYVSALVNRVLYNNNNGLKNEVFYPSVSYFFTKTGIGNRNKDNWIKETDSIYAKVNDKTMSLKTQLIEFYVHSYNNGDENMDPDQLYQNSATNGHGFLISAEDCTGALVRDWIYENWGAEIETEVANLLNISSFKIIVKTTQAGVNDVHRNTLFLTDENYMEISFPITLKGTRNDIEGKQIPALNNSDNFVLIAKPQFNTQSLYLAFRLGLSLWYNTNVLGLTSETEWDAVDPTKDVLKSNFKNTVWEFLRVTNANLTQFGNDEEQQKTTLANNLKEILYGTKPYAIHGDLRSAIEYYETKFPSMVSGPNFINALKLASFSYP